MQRSDFYISHKCNKLLLHVVVLLSFALDIINILYITKCHYKIPTLLLSSCNFQRLPNKAFNTKAALSKTSPTKAEASCRRHG
jgi:hypothetical protein